MAVRLPSCLWSARLSISCHWRSRADQFLTAQPKVGKELTLRPSGIGDKIWNGPHISAYGGSEFTSRMCGDASARRGDFWWRIDRSFVSTHRPSAPRKLTPLAWAVCGSQKENKWCSREWKRFQEIFKAAQVFFKIIKRSPHELLKDFWDFLWGGADMLFLFSLIITAPPLRLRRYKKSNVRPVLLFQG